jgi:hypothetical protein
MAFCTPSSIVEQNLWRALSGKKAGTAFYPEVPDEVAWFDSFYWNAPTVSQ